MTREQLEGFHRKLTLLSPGVVKERYRQAADRGRFLELPTPRVIQERVAALEGPLEVAPLNRLFANF
jgi:hypothetical protein